MERIVNRFLDMGDTILQGVYRYCLDLGNTHMGDISITVGQEGTIYDVCSLRMS